MEISSRRRRRISQRHKRWGDSGESASIRLWMRMLRAGAGGVSDLEGSFTGNPPPLPPSICGIRSERLALIKAHFTDGKEGRWGGMVLSDAASFLPPSLLLVRLLLLTPLGPRALCLPWEKWAKRESGDVRDEGGGVMFVHVFPFLF